VCCADVLHAISFPFTAASNFHRQKIPDWAIEHTRLFVSERSEHEQSRRMSQSKQKTVSFVDSAE
jgi:hypothetical protein